MCVYIHRLWMADSIGCILCIYTRSRAGELFSSLFPLSAAQESASLYSRLFCSGERMLISYAAARRRKRVDDFFFKRCLYIILCVYVRRAPTYSDRRIYTAIILATGHEVLVLYGSVERKYYFVSGLFLYEYIQ